MMSTTVSQPQLERTIGVLQHLQVLFAEQGDDISLADVEGLVRDIQRRFGENCQLESVIQTLVGEHLSQQLLARRLARGTCIGN